MSLTIQATHLENGEEVGVGTHCAWSGRRTRAIQTFTGNRLTHRILCADTLTEFAYVLRQLH